MSSRIRPATFLLVSALFMGLFLVVSCSGRYDFVLRPDGSADLAFSASLEPQTARLVTNLASFAREGGAASEPLLDAARLAASLGSSASVSSISLRNPDMRSVAGTMKVTDLERFLADPSPENKAGSSISANRFVRIERSSSGGRIFLSLDRRSGAALLGNLSPDIFDYVSALLAPVATGEDLGTAAYLALVESMYGKGVASEIAAAGIRASVELPGEAVSARGGTVRGRKVDFSLPLVDLLVLERPIELEATWK